MRVLFVHSPSDLYGASRSLLRLSSRLARDGHSIGVVLQSDGPLVEELRKSGVRTFVHPHLSLITRHSFSNVSAVLASLLTLPLSLVDLISLIQEFRPDLVHTNTALIPAPGVAAKLLGVSHVWHIRESFGEFSGFWRLYRRFIRFFADAIVCVSIAVARQFGDEVPDGKVKVINNGFPRGEFYPVEAERVEAFRRRFNLEDETTVGVIGRIKLGRKGQDVFVKAVALLNGKFPRTRFLLIGSPFPGNEEHLLRLQDLIRELRIEDKIVYTGDVPDIKAAFSALDLVVLPSSLPEPFGGVVVEAMAFGKPVIGTNIGGTVEQIEDGQTGYLVSPNDPEDLAKALDALLKDGQLRRRMGDRAEERFRSLFEFEPFYEKILSLYDKLVLRRDV